MLLFCFVVFIVHASIFCLCFCQKQSANQAKKKYRGILFYLIEKHMKKFRHFWREKNFTWKSHLRPSCTKPFNCSKTKRRFYDCHIYLAPYCFSGFSQYRYRGRKRDEAWSKRRRIHIRLIPILTTNLGGELVRAIKKCEGLALAHWSSLRFCSVSAKNRYFNCTLNWI